MKLLVVLWLGGMEGLPFGWVLNFNEKRFEASEGIREKHFLIDEIFDEMVENLSLQAQQEQLNNVT